MHNCTTSKLNTASEQFIHKCTTSKPTVPQVNSFKQSVLLPLHYTSVRYWQRQKASLIIKGSIGKAFLEVIKK